MSSRNYRNIDRTQAPGYFGQGASASIISAGGGGNVANPNVIEVTAGEHIYSGNAVYVKEEVDGENATNLCYNQTPNIAPNTDYYTTLGIALNEAEEDEMVQVQHSGTVNYNDLKDDFEGFEGQQLVVGDDSENNVSIDILTAWQDYNRVIIVGDIIFRNLIKIRIREYINN